MRRSSALTGTRVRAGPRRPHARATIARPHSAHERPWAAGARSVRWVPLAARHSSRPRRSTKAVTGSDGWALVRSVAAGERVASVHRAQARGRAPNGRGGH
eukprot:5385422-Prymnesium_polylepis.1